MILQTSSHQTLCSLSNFELDSFENVKLLNIFFVAITVIFSQTGYISVSFLYLNSTFVTIFFFFVFNKSFAAFFVDYLSCFVQIPNVFV